VAQQAVEDFTAVPETDPESEVDGRRKVLAEVARRQGQKAFRGRLIDAYGGSCAISGTSVLDVLQAAHIRPYNGPSTNHVTNGLLLRADLHTLFDLKLITVDPSSMAICVSPLLADTPYASLHGNLLSIPPESAKRPSHQALSKHYASALGLSAAAPAG
jgi:predicted restriction endonuclease